MARNLCAFLGLLTSAVLVTAQTTVLIAPSGPQVTAPSDPQDISVTCLPQKRSSVIPDGVIDETRLRAVMSTIKDIICPYTNRDYCHLFTSACTWEAPISRGEADYKLVVTKTSITTPGDGQTARLGNCTDVLDRIFDQCIDSDIKAVSGYARYAGLHYKIEFARAEPVLTNEQLHGRYVAPEEGPKVFNVFPQRVKDIINGVAPPSNPTSGPTPGQIRPKVAEDPMENCLDDANRVIAKLNTDFGDEININSQEDVAKFVDFARGEDNTQINDWWRVASSGNFSLVIGKDAEHYGLSNDIPPYKKEDLVRFVEDRKWWFCRPKNPKWVGREREQLPGTGWYQACIADDQYYKQCSGHWDIPRKDYYKREE